MNIKPYVISVASAFEAAGVGILAVGALWALLRAAAAYVRAGMRSGLSAFTQLRTDLGRSILLGLEILVAADIIRTVAVRPTLRGVAVLGMIVLIRTFLSFSLEIEIDGTLPWRRQAKSQTPES